MSRSLEKSHFTHHTRAFVKYILATTVSADQTALLPFYGVNGLFQKGVTHSRNLARPLLYLTSIRRQLGLSNEVQKSTELPVVQKRAAIKFGSTKKSPSK